MGTSNSSHSNILNEVCRISQENQILRDQMARQSEILEQQAVALQYMDTVRTEIARLTVDNAQMREELKAQAGKIDQLTRNWQPKTTVQASTIRIKKPGQASP